MTSISPSRLAPTFFSSDERESLYNGSQDIFEKYAHMAVNSGVHSLKKKVDLGTFSTKTFLDLQEKLSSIRHLCAMDQDTENAQAFGSPRYARSLPSCNRYFMSLTPLGHQYKPYSKRVLSSLARSLQSTTRSPFSFPDTTCVQTQKVNKNTIEKSSKLSTEVFVDARKLFQVEHTIEELEEALGKKIDCRDFAEAVNRIGGDYALMLTLKKNNRALYDSIIYGGFFPNLMMGIFNSSLDADYLKSGLVLAKVHMQIEDKLYAMGGHLTWYYLDHKTDPLERMKERSISTVLHQDPFLIEDTLHDISKVFEKAILWDKKEESLEVLKNRVALIRYMYAYAMPNFRGDGAIGDWLEMIIYHFHGFTDTQYKEGILPPFEPLACLQFQEYLDRYDKTIDIAPLEKGHDVLLAKNAPQEARKDTKIILSGALLALVFALMISKWADEPAF